MLHDTFDYWITYYTVSGRLSPVEFYSTSTVYCVAALALLYNVTLKKMN